MKSIKVYQRRVTNKQGVSFKRLIRFLDKLKVKHCVKRLVMDRVEYGDIKPYRLELFVFE